MLPLYLAIPRYASITILVVCSSGPGDLSGRASPPAAAGRFFAAAQNDSDRALARAAGVRREADDPRRRLPVGDLQQPERPQLLLVVARIGGTARVDDQDAVVVTYLGVVRIAADDQVHRAAEAPRYVAIEREVLRGQKDVDQPAGVLIVT